MSEVAILKQKLKDTQAECDRLHIDVMMLHSAFCDSRNEYHRLNERIHRTYIMNPDHALVLRHRAGIVTHATAPSYVGMKIHDAIGGAMSVMRYELGTELHPTSADGYPQVVEEVSFE